MLNAISQRIFLPLSALLLLIFPGSVLAAPNPGTWNGPAVYAGEKLGPIPIPVSESSLTTIASLSVPVGRWVAFAKFDGHFPSGGANITCDLIAGSGANQTRQRGWTRVGIYGNEDPGAGNVSLNLEHTFTDLGGKFRLRCMADFAQVTAHYVRIMAMRVGALTNRALSSGLAISSGSGKPVVVHGYRNSAVVVPNSDSFSSVATMPLPAGKWWIRADFSAFEVEDHGTEPYACQMLAGDQKDAVSGLLEDRGDATMVDFSVATAISPRRTLDDVRLNCKGLGLEVRDIRITAVNIGTLTQVVFTNASSTTTGAGLPLAIHGQRFLAPDLTHSYASLGQFGLAAGKWMVSAKVTTVAGYTIQCRLRDGADVDATYEEFPDYGRTMAMQIATTANSARQLIIDCRDPLGPTPPDATQVRYIKVTALRLATLVLRDL